MDYHLLAAVQTIAQEQERGKSSVKMLQSWETTTAILRLANECKLLPTVINLLMLSRSPLTWGSQRNKISWIGMISLTTLISNWIQIRSNSLTYHCLQVKLMRSGACHALQWESPKVRITTMHNVEWQNNIDATLTFHQNASFHKFKTWSTHCAKVVFSLHKH